jgi:hypothetical protein
MKKSKRVNITITPEYYEMVKKDNVNLSSLVREALEDHFNADKITLSVTKKTHGLYQQLFVEENASDKDFEPFLKDALKKYIEHVIKNNKEKLEKIKSQL